MKFLLDQDVYAATERFIKSLGHDVVTAADLNLQRAKDIVLLQEAAKQNRIFVTRDRDYGGEDKLRKAFIVVETGRHRLRKINS